MTARLTIKAALRLAQNSVALVHHRGDMWIVRARGADGLVTESEPLPRVAAKTERRVARICLAMAALGVPVAEAARIAKAERNTRREWTMAVRAAIGRRGR